MGVGDGVDDGHEKEGGDGADDAREPAVVVDGESEEFVEGDVAGEAAGDRCSEEDDSECGPEVTAGVADAVE